MLHVRRFLLVSSFLFLLVCAAGAQQQSATRNGQIVDSTGALIPRAKVTIDDADRGILRTATSDEHGEYAISFHPPDDHYTLTVAKAEFETVIQRQLSLQVAQRATLNVVLKTGGTTETITVNAEAPLLDTTSSTEGQVITGESVEALPLNGRSTFRLIQLTPGAVFSNGAYGQFGDTAVNTTFDSNFRINGGRASSNEFLIDGVPTTTGFLDQLTTDPIPDETQEFKVESTNLSAEFGRFSGGVINVSSKSGTNEIHGDAFEFFRNSALDANDWFSNHAGKPIPLFHMNQFGGVVGGPVWLPRMYNGKNSTFSSSAIPGPIAPRIRPIQRLFRQTRGRRATFLVDRSDL